MNIYIYVSVCVCVCVSVCLHSVRICVCWPVDFIKGDKDLELSFLISFFCVHV